MGSRNTRTRERDLPLEDLLCFSELERWKRDKRVVIKKAEMYASGKERYEQLTSLQNHRKV